MKHLFQITVLIGLLFIAPNSLAQAVKAKQTTIKYKNGDKYIGETRKCLKQKLLTALENSNTEKGLSITQTVIN